MAPQGGHLTAYAPRLALEWIERRPEARHQELEGALLFMDLSGFTAMSERLAKLGRAGAEEVVEIIDHTFDELLTLAYEVGGGLLKFGGDALLLWFGGAAGATAAAHAAHRMRTWLREHNPIATPTGPVRLRMSAGLHSGRFDAFLVGASHRELILCGPAVTTTVELEHRARAGQILVSEEAMEAIGGRWFGKREAGGRLLRGCPPAQTEQAERQRTRDTATLLLPAALRSILVQGELDPEHRHAAVAFVRFGGTDGLLQAGDVARVAALLQELVERAQEACERHDVTFMGEDVDGDGGKLFLAAGAPTSAEDDTFRLVRAVHEVVRQPTALSVTAGLHHGPVFAGPVGPRHRRTYTLMGDTVNTAARIMANAPPGEVLVSRPVADFLAGSVSVEEVAPFAAKGKRSLVHASRLIAVHTTGQAPQAWVLPFTGRAEPLDLLERSLAAARSGEGATVTLTGDAGVGKTRLLTELRAGADDIHWAEVRGGRHHHGDAYAPFRPVLGTLVDQAVPEGADLTRWRRRLHDRAVAALERARGDEPLALVIDDAQWLDEPSRALLGHLCRTATRRPWLVVACGRSVPDVESLVDIRLDGLDGDDAVRLAMAAASRPLLRDHARLIARRAGGNPLFVQQLASTFDPEDAGGLPPSLEALVATRIDRLGPADRRHLRKLAVLGETTTTEAASLLGVTPRRLQAVLLPLAELVEVEGGRIRFREQLYQEVAYEGLPYRRRRELHAAAADLLLARSDADEQPALLGHHLHHAARWEASWDWCRIAAERAASRGGHVEAVALLRWALEGASRSGCASDEERGHAWLALGDSLRFCGRQADALLPYRRARKLLAADRSASARLCLLECDLRRRMGKPVAAMRWCLRGLRLLDAARDITEDERRTQVRLLLERAMVRLDQSRHGEAVTALEEALAQARRAGDRAGEAHACLWLEQAHAKLGEQPPEPYGERALEIYDDIDTHGWWRAQALAVLAWTRRHHGRWQEALAHGRRARAALSEHGGVAEYAVASYNLGEHLAECGNLDEALEALTEAHQVFRAAGHAYEPAAAAALARVLAHRGEDAAAATLFAEAHQAMAAGPLISLAHETAARWAESRLLAGDPHGALDIVDRLPGEVPTAVAATAARVRGTAHLTIGDVTEGRQALQQALRLAEQAGSHYERVLAHDLLAAAGGPGADAHAARARQLTDQLGIVRIPSWLPRQPTAQEV